MSVDSPEKKRLRLQEIVRKLSSNVPIKQKSVVPDEDKEEQIDDTAVTQEERRVSTHRAHLAKTYVPPSSPAISESSTGDDATSVEKESLGDDETQKETGPTRPLRCGVCDLRVYKSYRYISRSSAPNHLKNFFKPDDERFRVCKRCFSSKERCRQNLALTLLKSKTEQMAYLRTPLGVTYHRATRALQYLSRDLNNNWKRPYDDLICDETLDDDYLSDIEDNFSLSSENKQPKLNAGSLCNGIDKVPTGMKSVGVVTVVRPISNSFQAFPNFFTIYGDTAVDVNANENTNGRQKEGSTTILEAKHVEKPEPIKQRDESAKNGGLKNDDISTINNKLTLLDHAYALPAAKSTKVSKVQKSGSKPSKPDEVSKPVKPVEAKMLVKKDAASDNKESSAQRTCGIVCSICDHLVTKSYSCYKKEDAPEKIKHLFTPNMKIMKVCRRCVPYKKPKLDGTAPIKIFKAKGKMLQSKLIKQKLKKVKKLKIAALKAVKSEISTQTKGLSSGGKSQQKPAKDGTKRNTIIEKVKVKKDGTDSQNPKIVDKSSEKGIKVSNMSSVSAIGKISANNFDVRGTLRSTSPRAWTATIRGTEAGDTTQTLLTMIYKPIKVEILNANTLTQILKRDSSDTSSPSTADSTENLNVDSGTQPMRSLIGIKKVKAKVKSEGETKDNTEDEPLKTNNSSEEPVISSGTSSDEKQNKTNEEQQKPTKDTKEEQQEEITKTKPESENTDENTSKVNEQSTKSETKGAQLSLESKGNLRSLNVKPVVEPVRSSPRRDKNIIGGRKEMITDKVLPTTTIVTRKRLALSESESGNVKEDEESHSKPAAKKRVIRKGKGLRKAGDSESDSRSRVAGGPSDEDGKDAKKQPDEGGEVGKKDSTHSYSTRWTQSPIRCTCCKEKVVKSYRCVQLGSSPAHLKSLFAREGTNVMRICRKCLGFPARVKAFL